MSEDLKSCPYCGRCDFLKLVKRPSHRQINCEWCGGRGPTQSVGDGWTAEEMWNKRAENEVYLSMDDAGDDAKHVLEMIMKQHFFHTYAPLDLQTLVRKVVEGKV